MDVHAVPENEDDQQLLVVRLQLEETRSELQELTKVAAEKDGRLAEASREAADLHQKVGMQRILSNFE